MVQDTYELTFNVLAETQAKVTVKFLQLYIFSLEGVSLITYSYKRTSIRNWMKSSKKIKM